MDGIRYKRFMVFEMCAYSTGGGLGDCDQSFEDLEDAIKYSETFLDKNSREYCWVEIFDRVKGEIVKH